MEFILSLTEELSTIDEGIKTLEKELGDIDTKAGSVYNKEFVEENDKKIVILAKGISKIEEDIAEKEGDDKYYDTLLKLFSNKDGGIKKILIERMINIFNEKISDFLPIFFNDKKVELFLDKNLNEVIMLNDEEIEFSEFSTGEQKRFEIAISFALFSVVKQFFSSSVSFMVFDEVLDNGLDKKGVEAVKAIIESFSKTNTVIVISHKEEYKESFENRIALMKDDKDYSRIVEA
jgi:DNA repair exonuclease SbcCD ATPase subunit